MKKFLIAAAVVTAAFGATASFADDSLFDRNEHGVISAIEAQGYKVSGVEEWGTVVRAFIVDATGRSTMALFDADSLKLVRVL